MVFLGGIWGRIVMVLVVLSGIAASLFAIRWRIRRKAQEDMSDEIQKRTLERLENAKCAVDEFRSDGRDIRDKLRDQGYLRD
jgi:uncharacterized iron-regulated membrane protein